MARRKRDRTRKRQATAVILSEPDSSMSPIVYIAGGALAGYYLLPSVVSLDPMMSAVAGAAAGYAAHQYMGL